MPAFYREHRKLADPQIPKVEEGASSPLTKIMENMVTQINERQLNDNKFLIIFQIVATVLCTSRHILLYIAYQDSPSASAQTVGLVKICSVFIQILVFLKTGNMSCTALKMQGEELQRTARAWARSSHL